MGKMNNDNRCVLIFAYVDDCWHRWSGYQLVQIKASLKCRFI